MIRSLITENNTKNLHTSEYLKGYFDDEIRNNDSCMYHILLSFSTTQNNKDYVGLPD